MFRTYSNSPYHYQIRSRCLHMHGTMAGGSPRRTRTGDGTERSDPPWTHTAVPVRAGSSRKKTHAACMHLGFSRVVEEEDERR